VRLQSPLFEEERRVLVIVAIEPLMGGNVLCAEAAFAAFCQHTKGSCATSYQLFMNY